MYVDSEVTKNVKWSSVHDEGEDYPQFHLNETLKNRGPDAEGYDRLFSECNLLARFVNG
jgi:hypothetical protein